MDIMTEQQAPLSKWILIVSGLFAVMELGVGATLFLAPESFADNVDTTARGVDFLLYMWATRQFALGVIFAFATFKRSIPMLSLAYLFLLVMFLGDLTVGILQKNESLIIGGVVMSLIASVLLFVINKKK